MREEGGQQGSIEYAGELPIRFASANILCYINLSEGPPQRIFHAKSSCCPSVEFICRAVSKDGRQFLQKTCGRHSKIYVEWRWVPFLMASSYSYTVTMPGVALRTPGALFNMSGNEVLDFIPTARLILPRKVIQM